MRSSRRIGYLLLPTFGLLMATVLAALFQAGESWAAGGDIPDITLSPFATVDFSPTDIANSGVAGDDRLFVALQDGRINLIESDGTVQATPFLSITDRVFGGGQQGLLGLVFDPDYDSNGYFYVNYIYEDVSNDKFTRVSRFSVTGDPDIADPNSEFVIFTIQQPGPDNNGGDLNFGPDGYLYIAMGDGEDDGDDDNRAQDGQQLLGKVLRIDVSGTTSTTNYLIPGDNPFVGNGGVLDEIWAIGVRNPWRFSFDSATGDLYIADVGRESVEEINFQPAASPGGENYGWRCYEGDSEFNTTGCGPMGDYDFPVFTYTHSLPGCAVTGGFVYRGSEFPNMVGHYFFADYCFARIWSLDVDNGHQLAVDESFSGVLFTSFGEDINGELYIADSLDNVIYRIMEAAEASYLPFVRSD